MASPLPTPSPATPPPLTPVRVLVVDDHPVVRLGVKAMLDEAGDFRVDGEAGDSAGALQLARQAAADLMVLDLMMPGQDGFRLVQDVRREAPRLPLVIFSGLTELAYAPSVFAMGVRGFVQKDEGLPTLLTALRQVVAGRRYASQRLKDDYFERQARPAGDATDLASLSDQELNVFRLSGLGLPLKELADKLGISPRTVGTHRERIKGKLGLRSIRDLEHLARGLIN